MSEKYTPGPWEIKGYDNNKSEGYVWGHHDFLDRDELLATVRSGTILMSEVEANARLIAAAPDMLEALEEIEKHLHPDGFFDEKAVRYALKWTQQAIAKAKGGVK